jgi:hypothetical protein
MPNDGQLGEYEIIKRHGDNFKEEENLDGAPPLDSRDT